MSWVARHLNGLFVAVAAVLILAMPDIAGNEYALRFYTLMLIYMILALGLNVLVGFTGLVSLGQAGLYAIGAYTAAILATRVGIGFVPCLVLGMVFAGVFGVLLAYPTVRVRGVYLAVVTIAFGIIVENIAIEWDSLTGSWVGISNVPKPTLLGLPMNHKVYFYFVGLSALIAFAVNVNIMNSRYGRAMLGTSQSEIAASSLGISVTAMRTLAFVLSAVTAGAAGVLYVFLNKYISPDIFSFSDSIRFLLMVILGGAGTTLGPVVGAGLLSYLPELLQQFGEWQRFVYGALLAAVMFFLPRGIVGSATDLLQRFTSRPAPNRTASSGKSIGEIVGVETVGAGNCLEARNISLHFGGLAALNKVDANIGSGKIHGLIGPNGAGKSTLLNAVSGIYRVSSGRNYFFGEDITKMKSHQLARRGLARTFQNTEMFGEMTVLENVWTGFYSDYRTGLLSAILRLPAYRNEEEKFRKSALDLLEFVGLSDSAFEKAKNLPFGFQRRLEIARALATKPKLILLDEPAAGLTQSEIDDLRDLIIRLSEHGITIVVVEHHIELVMAISSHITVLDYGEVIAEGSAADVQADPKVIEAYFGSPEMLEHVAGDKNSGRSAPEGAS
ncbi:MAG: branched-chain amino acid ABC transporter ATP-binding protein/permease [Albidovulum sp.]|nr:branched-chain amino acid ABC transporter ATP-binding protein/permease [Albidovulum sp.]